MVGFVGFAFVFVACSSPDEKDALVTEKWDDPTGKPSMQVGSVNITVLEAQVRRSFQTHYLMTYAEPGKLFYEVILLIDGADMPLAWGRENLSLIYMDNNAELVLTRPIILDEQVTYRSGEELTYGYVYIYQVVQDSLFEKYELSANNGQSVQLGSVLRTVASNQPTQPTHQAGEYDVVAGGSNNLAAGPFATVSGGSDNLASAIHSSIGGGNLNRASASHTTVAGGRENIASGFYASVGGGYANQASGRDSTVAGGSRNIACKHHATVGGGIQNQACSSDSTVSGGSYNQALEVYAFLGGGTRNMADGYAAVLVGGAGNLSGGDHSSLVGGLGNLVEGEYSAIGGGHGNVVHGDYAVIPGGKLNQALGDYGFVAGYQGQVLEDHPGVFLFADSIGTPFESEKANEFAVRANGGIRFVTGVDGEGNAISGATLPAGSGAWANLSDQAAKQNFEEVDSVSILSKLSNLPLSTWNYVAQDVSIRHIGPMAQDFNAYFGFGDDERYISTMDADGVAFASIQGLYRLVQQQQAQLDTQEEQILQLQARLARLESIDNRNNIGFSDNINMKMTSWLVLGVFGYVILWKNHFVRFKNR
jgi:hypothetical protein